MSKLTCSICGRPLVKSRTDAWTEETLVQGTSTIDRAWHRSCEADIPPIDAPLQAAIQRAKQAIADARRLTESEQAVFVDVVRIALTEQRPDLSPTPERD